MEPKSSPSLLATISIWSFLAPTLCDTVENHVQPHIRTAAAE